jgi:hypothetical protein
MDALRSARVNRIAKRPLDPSTLTDRPAPVAPRTGAIAPHQSQDNDSSRMPITPPAGLRPKPQDDREPLRAARVDSNELTVYIERLRRTSVIYPGARS